MTGRMSTTAQELFGALAQLSGVGVHGFGCPNPITPTVESMQMINAARAWIAANPAHVAQSWSYEWKARAEAHAGFYVPNGVAIVAAVLEGLHVVRAGDSPNAVTIAPEPRATKPVIPRDVLVALLNSAPDMVGMYAQRNGLSHADVAAAVAALTPPLRATTTVADVEALVLRHPKLKRIGFIAYGGVDLVLDAIDASRAAIRAGRPPADGKGNVALIASLLEDAYAQSAHGSN